MSNKLPSRLQTLPLKDTQCDLQHQGLGFFTVHTPEKITVELICSRACRVRTPAQGTHRRHGHQTRCSFVRRTASSRGQRKRTDRLLQSHTSLQRWLTVAKSKFCFKLGSFGMSSTANFSGTIQQEKNHSTGKQLKRLKGSLGLCLTVGMLR